LIRAIGSFRQDRTFAGAYLNGQFWSRAAISGVLIAKTASALMSGIPARDTPL